MLYSWLIVTRNPWAYRTRHRPHGPARVLSVSFQRPDHTGAHDPNPPTNLADLMPAFVANTPGLVYQFILHADGSVAFPYLSEGCAALLGPARGRTAGRPERFLELIVPRRPPGLSRCDAGVGRSLSGWNWEGRIWIDAYKDQKWINLRSTPRALPKPPAACTGKAS